MRKSKPRSWIILSAVLVGGAAGYAAAPASSREAQKNPVGPAPGAAEAVLREALKDPAFKLPPGVSEEVLLSDQSFKLPPGVSEDLLREALKDPAFKLPPDVSEEVLREAVKDRSSKLPPSIPEQPAKGAQKGNSAFRVPARLLVKLPPRQIITERDILEVLRSLPPGRIITERDISERLQSLPPDRNIVPPERVITEREINEAFRSLPADQEVTVRSFSEALRSIPPSRMIVEPNVVRSTGPGQSEQLTAMNRTLWGLGARIPVCWDNPSDAHSQERAWVQDAVSKSWQANADVEFNGWGACAVDVTSGIRITVSDTQDGAYTLGLGNELFGRKGGIVLNFTFGNWKENQCGGTNADQRRETCIRSVAVHEFGHALGFAHEQTRANTPRECDEEKSGGAGDTELTDYDPDSVMNYCNPDRNKGVLSVLDKAGVQKAYGARA